MSKIRKVLIANRGEIAARILRTLNAMGLQSVVVYHPVDLGTLAVSSADETYQLHGASPVASYLDAAQIIKAAKETDADAIHPGYGFLSENAQFSRACAEAGIIFIGPDGDTIELMGDKVGARNFVEQRGFPVAPSAIEDNDPDTFVERAREVGAPLLIKPSAGGGGKGMRIVRDLDTLEAEIATARREGERYFGDGRLFVERYIEKPKHIEVQVLGDTLGNVVHLFERECSLQRRFQKVVEEAPSPSLSKTERKKICEVAAGIAKAANYVGAGTVEFIYGAGEFYFLEMNTRIQVEHPVTEEITGVDLIAEQVRIAMGEAISVRQKDLKIGGHSIEVRIYAEDSERDFAPTTGPLLKMLAPVGEGIRVDSGVVEGGQITAAFDPMIAKLIVHADDREQALEKAKASLAEYVILGCKTNVDFLRRLLDDEDVKSGAFHTGSIKEKLDICKGAEISLDQRDKLLAIAAMFTREIRETADAVPDLHNNIGRWRN
ncbi:MAG: acetyl-CoA carboxylase biotin carboxylase subunit [Hyphomonas sp.]